MIRERSPPVQPSTTIPTQSFPVRLLFYIAEHQLRARTEEAASLWDEPEPVFAVNERFRFSPFFFGSEEKLLEYLHRFHWHDRAVVIVSDRLTKTDSTGTVAPNELTDKIRTLYRDSKYPVGLVALHDRGLRVSDIDRVIVIGPADLGPIRAAVVRTANGLRLKSPPSSQGSDQSVGPVSVRVAQSEDELLSCFQLRHLVYEMLSYLPEEIATHPAKIDLDRHDNQSIHFLAIVGNESEIAGTVRLVLPCPPSTTGFTLSRRRPRTLKAHGLWCQAIAAHTDAKHEARACFLRMMNEPVFHPMPILQSADFAPPLPPILTNPHVGAELSRLVVHPRHRGLGVSRLLVRACIAKALQMQRETIVLECIPLHQGMYESYGFRRLRQVTHCRAQGLDQRAVAMGLRVNEDSKATRIAQEDLELIDAERHDLFRDFDVT
jgi:ribosomal protein S18 acetylase RimI-like enzyme